jgi:hypothetical protein
MNYLSSILFICFVATNCVIIKEPPENILHNYKIINDFTQAVRVDFYDSNDAIVNNYISILLEPSEIWDSTTIDNYNTNPVDNVKPLNRGDSAVITFADFKKLTYYPSVNIETKNLMSQFSYLEEDNPTTNQSRNLVYNFTFTITEEDYLMAE